MATVDETHALAVEVLRLREALRWYVRFTGQLQEELRVTQALSDFWAAEADRLEAGRVGGDCVDDIEDWHRRNR